LHDFAFLYLYDVSNYHPEFQIFTIKQSFWEIEDNFLKALFHAKVETDKAVIFIKFYVMQMLFGLTH